MEERERYARNYELIRRAQSSDRAEAAEATEQLLNENMGLVRSAVQRFRDRGTEYEDLLQIGVMGMLRAIRTFDLSRGTAFSTFAVPLIVGEIRRHLRDDGMIRISRGYKKLAADLMRVRREIAEREGREAVCDVVSVKFKIGLNCKWFDKFAKAMDRPTNAVLEGSRWQAQIDFTKKEKDPNKPLSPSGYWANAIMVCPIEQNPFSGQAFESAANETQETTQEAGQDEGDGLPFD